jgi:hypothetical protein
MAIYGVSNLLNPSSAKQEQSLKNTECTLINEELLQRSTEKKILYLM